MRKETFLKIRQFQKRDHNNPKKLFRTEVVVLTESMFQNRAWWGPTKSHQKSHLFLPKFIKSKYGNSQKLATNCY